MGHQPVEVLTQSAMISWSSRRTHLFPPPKPLTTTPVLGHISEALSVNELVMLALCGYASFTPYQEQYREM